MRAVFTTAAAIRGDRARQGQWAFCLPPSTSLMIRIRIRAGTGTCGCPTTRARAVPSVPSIQLRGGSFHNYRRMMSGMSAEARKSL